MDWDRIEAWGYTILGLFFILGFVLQSLTREVNKHEQLTFDFDKEYPSLLEPLQKKEKELEVESSDLIPLKIKLINFYFAKGDVSNIHKYIS